MTDVVQAPQDLSRRLKNNWPMGCPILLGLVNAFKAFSHLHKGTK